jgi:hypothetical protein
MWAVLELGHLPLAIHWFIRDAWQQSLARWGQTSDHCILCAPSFQGDEHRIEAEAGVGAGTQRANLGWNMGEAGVQHFNAAIQAERGSPDRPL